jgi:hypothetical protein
LFSFRFAAPKEDCDISSVESLEVGLLFVEGFFRVVVVDWVILFAARDAQTSRILHGKRKMKIRFLYN